MASKKTNRRSLVDHKNPKDKGGSDQLRNLQPLQWEENREKEAKAQRKGK